MIEEQGRVVALEPGAVWVETLRHTACQSCAASKGCGHAMMDNQRAGSRARVRALSDQSLALHDDVVLGIPEGSLLRGAVIVYLIPLLLLLFGALAGQALLAVSSVDGAAVGGVIGLAGGFLIIRWYSVRHRHDPTLQPRVLRRVSPDTLSCLQVRDPL